MVKFSDPQKGKQKGFISDVEVISGIKILATHRVLYHVDCKELRPIQVCIEAVHAWVMDWAAAHPYPSPSPSPSLPFLLPLPLPLPLFLSLSLSLPPPPLSIKGHLTFSSQSITNAPPCGAAQGVKAPLWTTEEETKLTGAYFSWQMPHPRNCQVVKCPIYYPEGGGGMGGRGFDWYITVRLN